MERVIDLFLDDVRDTLARLPGVQGVHDLHVWTITSGMVALSAHLIAEERRPELLSNARHTLSHRFAITHATIQVERERGEDCPGGC